MTLPVLFTNRLQNPDELTDDVVGVLCLMLIWLTNMSKWTIS